MADRPDPPESTGRRLNRMVAVTVVALSVAMAIGKIKDDNIVQAMQADQAAKIDLWGEYQATRIKGHVQDVAATLMGATPAAAASRDGAKRYAGEAKGLRARALAAQADYDRQGRRDDQFDLSDGCFSIALAATAIAALIESFGLLAVGWAAAAGGLLFLVAGFEALAIHPDALVAFLS